MTAKDVEPVRVYGGGTGPAQEIDAIGLLCPLPVLKLQKALKAAAPGDTVILRATDPMSRVDVPHFCSQGGHSLVDTREDGAELVYVVRCGGTTAPSL